MLLSPVQLYEQERLLDLLALEILDSPPEEAFDDIVRQTAQLCNAPLALISFLDDTRQWIKAQVGLAEEVDIAREVALCAATIMEEGPVVLTDVRGQERFRHNPLLKRYPAIQFYAGFPLQTAQGYNVGTLSILDTGNRTLDEQQQLLLRVSAARVVRELELRRITHQLTRTQRRLDQLENRLLDAEKLAGIGLWEYEAATENFSCTQQALDILRVAPAERKRQHFSLLPYLTEPDQRAFSQQWEQALHEGQDLHQLAQLAQDPTVWLDIRAVARRQAAAGYRLIGMIRDVTAPVSPPHALSMVPAHFGPAAPTQAQLVARMVAEIQPPVEYLVEHLEILMQEEGLSRGHKNDLRSVHSLLHHVHLRLSNSLDLLALQRASAVPRHQPFALKALLNQVHRLLLVKASEKELTFEMSIDAAVPEEVTGDAARLSQVLYNLLDNAIRCTEKGVVKLAVDVAYQSDRDWVMEFVISDTGPGMPAEQQALFAGTFVPPPVATAPSLPPAAGLGLTITAQLVALLKGRIRLVSGVGQGATFTICVRYEKPFALAADDAVSKER